MNSDINLSAPLTIRPSKEKYGWMFTLSIAIHALVVLVALFSGSLFPKSTITIGTGPGGGQGGESYTVGTVEELSGGAGMTKPALIPAPPAMVEEEPPAPKAKAIPLPNTKEKRKLSDREIKQASKAPQNSSQIPTEAEPGSGGANGSRGSGGGWGGGNGISVGEGSGGFGDPRLASYARSVEERIGKSWAKPEGQRVDMTYSFYILSDGSITNVRQERSSGNVNMDLQAERAIRSLSYPRLPAPPAVPGRSWIRFEARFVYPPNR
jgi:TonB family protein